MIYKYNLEESDYHTHLLYTVSRSSSAVKTRNNVRLLMTLSMMIFAFIAYGNGSTGQAIYFIFLMLISFFLMPLYTRWSYKKTYLKHVRKFYKDRMSEPTNVEINLLNIHVSDSQGESIITFDQIDTINELNDAVFLKLKSGTSIIFPIHSIDEKDKLLLELQTISTDHNIQWNDEKNWIWK